MGSFSVCKTKFVTLEKQRLLGWAEAVEKVCFLCEGAMKQKLYSTVTGLETGAEDCHWPGHAIAREMREAANGK